MDLESSYPADYANVLLRGLPRNQSAILETLLDLFSSVSARSATNGMTPRFISGLFSPYIFGLSEDKNFDETYSEWLWFTDALEHVLLVVH